MYAATNPGGEDVPAELRSARRLSSAARVLSSPAAAQQSGNRARPAPPPPNIVIMYPDNLGYGEVAIYGGNRGVPTPRIDALAREGMRLTNFNVETFCTPSRAALLTGRYGVRSPAPSATRSRGRA